MSTETIEALATELGAGDNLDTTLLAEMGETPTPASAGNPPTDGAPAGDATPEAGDNAEPADESETGKKAMFVPKARFDEQVAKERARTKAANERIAELEAGSVKVANDNATTLIENEINALEIAYGEAINDGDTSALAEIKREIRARERELQRRETAGLAKHTVDQSREQAAIELAITELVTKHPELDENSEAFDEAASNELLEWQSFYVSQKKMSVAQALEAAAEKVFGKGQAPATKPAPDARKAGAVAVAIDAQRKQPPNLTSVGGDGDKHMSLTADAYAKMSEEDQDAVPEAVRAKLRGDFV